MSTTPCIPTQETPEDIVPARPWRTLPMVPTGIFAADEAGTKVAATKAEHGFPDTSYEVAEAIAAFIVKTANAHEALLRAVEAVIDASSDYLPPDGISKDEFINRVLGATDNAEINAALQALCR